MLRWLVAVACVVMACSAATITPPRIVTQLFSDTTCDNLLTSPLPRESESCAIDVFSNLYYGTTALDEDLTRFTVAVGCTDDECFSNCTYYNVSAGDCFVYDGKSLKVELAEIASLNASLFDSDNCSVYAVGYGSVTLESGVCAAAANDGLFVTLINVGGAQEVIFSFVCPPDCSACGYYSRAPVDECIDLPVPQFFGQVQVLPSAANVIQISSMLALIAALLYLL